MSRHPKRSRSPCFTLEVGRLCREVGRLRARASAAERTASMVRVGVKPYPRQPPGVERLRRTRASTGRTCAPPRHVPGRGRRTACSRAGSAGEAGTPCARGTRAGTRRSGSATSASCRHVGPGERPLAVLALSAGDARHASRPGQVAFNGITGSIPFRLAGVMDGLSVVALVERRGLSGDTLADLAEQIIGEGGFVRSRCLDAATRRKPVRGAKRRRSVCIRRSRRPCGCRSRCGAPRRRPSSTARGLRPALLAQIPLPVRIRREVGGVNGDVHRRSPAPSRGVGRLA